MQTTLTKWVADALAYNPEQPTIGKVLRDSSQITLQWSNQETSVLSSLRLDIFRQTFSFTLPNGVRIRCLFMEKDSGVFWMYPKN